MIEITRFSELGFFPQVQTFHMDNINSILNRDYLKYDVCDEIKQELDSVRLELNPNFSIGIWVFIKGKEDKWYLNHRKDLNTLPCFSATIHENAIVYIGDKKKHIMTVKEAITKSDNFFVPFESINAINNIEKIEWKWNN